MTEATPTNRTATLASYIPNAVVEWLRSGISLNAGETTQFNAVVIVAKFSGLGNLILRHSRNIPLGETSSTSQDIIEERINSVLAELISLIRKFDGIITQIDADALVAYIPQRAELMMTEIARRGLTCSLDLQNLLKTRSAAGLTESGRLSEFPGFGIKVGVAYGSLSATTVGGANTWQAFVIGGTALNWAVTCTQYAKRGQVVASANIIAPLRSAVTGEQFTGGHYRVADLSTRAETAPLPPLDDEKSWPDWLLPSLEPFVPPALLYHMATGVETPPPVHHNPAVCMSMMFEGPGYDDPNAGQHLMDYLQQADAIVRRHEGHIEQIYTANTYSDRQADGQSLLRIIFDTPSGIEAGQWQAITCALALQRSGFAPNYSQSIGLASGKIYTCTLGSSERRHYTIVGEVIHIADRLASRAGPGEIWVDSAIQAQTSRKFAFGRFDAEEMVYRLEGEQSTAGNLSHHYPLNRPPVVGREHELIAIDEVIEKAQQGQGQVLVLTGDAGVGKSRLAEALVTRWLEGKGRGYAASVPAHGKAVPFLPWIEIWRALCGLNPIDDSIIARDKLVARLRGLCERCDHAAALLGPLLGISMPVPETLAPLSVRARHTCMLNLCTESLLTISTEYPLLLVFENMQWADAASLTLLARLAPLIIDRPVLLCFTQRPPDEPIPGLYNFQHATHLELKPLTGAENWALVSQRVQPEDWPPALRARLETLFGRPGSDEPQANPLFVEEMAHYLLKQSRPPDILPATLEDLLAARLSRLDAVSRELLQAASVIGPIFSMPMLMEVEPDLAPPQALDAHLNALVADGFLENVSTEAEWRANRFRHPLMVKVAYNQMDPIQRRRRHARLAEHLATATVVCDAQHIPRVYALAVHYDAGTMPYRAAHYAMEAAAHAYRHYALSEALHHYAIVENNTKELPYEGERWPLYVEIGLNQGRIYLEQGNYSHAASAVDNALHLATTHRDRRRQAQAYNLKAALYVEQNRHEEAAQFVEDAIRIAEASGFELELVEAYRLKGLAYLHMGHRIEALRPFKRAFELAHTIGDPVLITENTAMMGMIYTANYMVIDALEILTKVLALIRPSGDQDRLAKYLSQLGWVYLQRGEGKLALSAYEEAAGILRSIDMEGRKLGAVLSRMANALCFNGQYKKARECLDEASALFAQSDDRVGLAKCQLVRGRALERDLGEREVAIENLNAALDGLSQTNDTDATLEALLALADIQTQLDQTEEANENLRLAQTYIELERARWFWPEYHLIAGRMAIKQEDYTAARDHAYKALSLISGRGDARTLPSIYLLLAQALQATQPDRTNAIQDALNRSVSAARGRSRRLDQVVALDSIGRYLKDEEKSTSKARGSGYLFEAELLMKQMGLS